MTDDRSIERAARSWLEAGPTQAPSRAVEAALLRIETTPQERDLRIPWRFSAMPMPARVAVAAVIGVLFVGGAVFMLGRPGQPAVGGPGPSPSVSAAPSPTPSPSPAARISAPARTMGDWQAILDSPLTNKPEVTGRIQLSIDWQNGVSSWIQTEAGEQIFMSDSVAAPTGEIDLVAADGSIGCRKGDLGRYAWNRSPDGLFLTLTTIDDACAARAEAYSRTWVHSLTAVTDGGMGVFPSGGWIQLTLPSMRWALDDTSLHNFDAGDPKTEFLAITNPEGYDQPCSTGGRTPIPQAAIGGATAVSAYTDYLRTRPGFDATVTDTRVDGYPAVGVTLTPDASLACPSGSYAIFSDGIKREIDPFQPHSFWIVNVGASTFILHYDGLGVTAADAQTVIDSVKFLGDQLPKP